MVSLDILLLLTSPEMAILALKAIFFSFSLESVFNIILFVYKNNTNEGLIAVTNLKLMLMFKGM